MSILNNILREIGLPGFGRTRKKSKSVFPPDVNEIKEQAEKVVEGLRELKEIPKSVMERAVEAEQDFREADKTFRGTRFGKKGK